MFSKSFVWGAVSLWALGGVWVVGYARAETDDLAAAEPPAADVPALDKKAAFVEGVVGRVSRRWSQTFLPMAAAQLPKDHKVNDPDRRVLVEQILDMRGEPLGLAVLTSSGSKDFDEAAVDVLRDLGAVGVPPEEALSDDDRVYIHWTMNRSGERLEGAVVVDHESAIELAVPRLLKKKRDAEAIRRLESKARLGQADGALGIFARTWLSREPQHAKAPPGCDRDVLKRHGDPGQAAMVSALVARPDVACDDALLELIANASLPVSLRARGIEALAAPQAPGAKKLLTELERSPLGGLRAAAIFASAQPGGGRAVLFRITPFLRDKDVEVRAAAGAGLVRSVGDAALDQLYLLFKESDPRPYERTAAELGRLTTQASADLLGRMLRKDAERVRFAAALALLGRSDEAAKKLLDGLASDRDSRLRALSATPSAEDRVAAAQSLGDRDGSVVEKLIQIPRGRSVAVLWTLQQWGGLDGPRRASLMRRWNDVLGANPTGSSIATVR